MSKRPLPPRRKNARLSRAFQVGSLLGVGAALVGLSPIVFGIRPWHVLVISAFLLAMSRRGVESLWRLQIKLVDLVFILFILLSAAVEYVNAGQLNYEPQLVSVFTDVFYVLAYMAARLSIDDVFSCASFLRGIVWPALPMTIVAVLQIVGVEAVIRFTMALAPTEAVVNRLERGDSLRAWGLTGHWTGFGGYLTCIVAALMCIMLIEKTTRDRVLKRDIVSLAALFSGVLATLTFSVLLSSLAIVLVSWRRLKMGVNGVVAMAVLAVSSMFILGPFLAGRFEQQFDPGVSAQDLPPWLPSTLAYRLTIWERETLPAFFERPFLGWGSGAYEGDTVGRMYPIQLDWLSAESQWLSLAIGYGIGVALLFGLLILVVGSTFMRAYRTMGAVYVEPFVVMWIALFSTSFTVAIFTNRGAPAVFYVLLGCTIAVSHACSQDRQSSADSCKSS